MTAERKSILFISTAANWPLIDGKRQRTWFLMEALSKEYEIDLLFIGSLTDMGHIEKSNNRIKNIYFVELEKSKYINSTYASFLFSKIDKLNKLLLHLLHHHLFLLKFQS